MTTDPRLHRAASLLATPAEDVVLAYAHLPLAWRADVLALVDQLVPLQEEAPRTALRSGYADMTVAEALTRAHPDLDVLAPNARTDRDDLGRAQHAALDAADTAAAQQVQDLLDAHEPGVLVEVARRRDEYRGAVVVLREVVDPAADPGFLVELSHQAEELESHGYPEQRRTLVDVLLETSTHPVLLRVKKVRDAGAELARARGRLRLARVLLEAGISESRLSTSSIEDLTLDERTRLILELCDQGRDPVSVLYFLLERGARFEEAEEWFDRACGDLGWRAQALLPALAILAARGADMTNDAVASASDDVERAILELFEHDVEEHLLWKPVLAYERYRSRTGRAHEVPFLGRAAEFLGRPGQAGAIAAVLAGTGDLDALSAPARMLADEASWRV